MPRLPSRRRKGGEKAEGESVSADSLGSSGPRSERGMDGRENDVGSGGELPRSSSQQEEGGVKSSEAEGTGQAASQRTRETDRGAAAGEASGEWGVRRAGSEYGGWGEVGDSVQGDEGWGSAGSAGAAREELERERGGERGDEKVPFMKGGRRRDRNSALADVDDDDDLQSDGDDDDDDDDENDENDDDGAGGEREALLDDEGEEEDDEDDERGSDASSDVSMTPSEAREERLRTRARQAVIGAGNLVVSLGVAAAEGLLFYLDAGKWLVANAGGAARRGLEVYRPVWEDTEADEPGGQDVEMGTLGSTGPDGERRTRPCLKERASLSRRTVCVPALILFIIAIVIVVKITVGWDGASRWVSRGKKGWGHLVGQGTEGGADEDGEDEGGGVPGAGLFPASPAPLTLSDMWRMIMCSKRWKPSSNAGGGGGGNRSTSSLFGLGCTAPAPELKMRYGFSLPQPSIDLSFIVSAPSPVSQAEAAVLQRHMATIAVFPWASQNVTAEILVVTWNITSTDRTPRLVTESFCTPSLSTRHLELPLFLWKQIMATSGGGGIEAVARNAAMRRAYGRRILVSTVGTPPSLSAMYWLSWSAVGYRSDVYGKNHSIAAGGATDAKCSGGGGEDDEDVMRGVRGVDCAASKSLYTGRGSGSSGASSGWVGGVMVATANAVFTLKGYAQAGGWEGAEEELVCRAERLMGVRTELLEGPCGSERGRGMGAKPESTGVAGVFGRGGACSLMMAGKLEEARNLIKEYVTLGWGYPSVPMQEYGYSHPRQAVAEWDKGERTGGDEAHHSETTCWGCPSRPASPGVGP